VHCAINGRVRYKISELYRSEKLGLFFEIKLSQIDKIKSFNVNITTGSVLIYYNSNYSLEDVNRLINTIVEEFKLTKPTLSDLKDRKKDTSLAVRLLSLFSKKTSNTEQKDSLTKISNNGGNRWYLVSSDDILRAFDSNKTFGLSIKKVEENLKRFGTNTLPDPVMRTKLEIFIEQFKSLPVLLLGIASTISIFTGGLADAIVILTVILLNATIGFVTESEVEKTITSLKKIIRPNALVVREGRIVEISVENIVPGDIFLLKPGSFVPADGRIIEAFNLTIDESALTGESMPVLKTSAVLVEECEDMEITLSERYNMVFMGTRVTSGQGIAIAVATGKNTEIGKIQTLMINEIAPKTHIEQQLDTIGRHLVIASSAICGVVFLIGIIRGYSFIEMIKMSISLAVAAVPEGLPTVATTTLSLGIRKMKKKGVLIRHLNAIENLGLVKTVCLDKTGTLTYNKMTVVEIYAGMKSYLVKEFGIYPKKKSKKDDIYSEFNKLDDISFTEELNLLMTISILCNESEIKFIDGTYKVNGSSTENALIELAFKSGIDINHILSKFTHITTKLRSKNVNYMVSVHSYEEDRENKLFLSIKGSPTEILDMCDCFIQDGKVKPG
jgi:Ca2+-transporting ATPase